MDSENCQLPCTLSYPELDHLPGEHELFQVEGLKKSSGKYCTIA